MLKFKIIFLIEKNPIIEFLGKKNKWESGPCFNPHSIRNFWEHIRIIPNCNFFGNGVGSGIASKSGSGSGGDHTLLPSLVEAEIAYTWFSFWRLKRIRSMLRLPLSWVSRLSSLKISRFLCTISTVRQTLQLFSCYFCSLVTSWAPQSSVFPSWCWIQAASDSLGTAFSLTVKP